MLGKWENLLAAEGTGCGCDMGEAEAGAGEPVKQGGKGLDFARACAHKHTGNVAYSQRSILSAWPHHVNRPT